MKKTLLIIVLLISIGIQAQSDFKNATINYRNGTIEKGLVKFGSKVDPNIIIYKKSIESDKKQLSANEIASCIFTEIKREIISVNIDGKNQFLEIIVKGKSNLLFYIEEKGEKRYFLKSEKSGLKELSMIEKYKDDQKFKLKKYIGILNIDFNDCTDIQTKIRNTSLTLSSLSNIFITYNQCQNKLDFKSERLVRSNNHKIEVEAGLYSTQIKPKGTADPSKFENKTTPYIGLNYIYTPTFFSSVVSLSAGVSYFNITSERELETQSLAQPNKIVLKAINYQFGLIFNLNGIDKKLSPNIGIYYIGMNPLQNKESVYRKIDDQGKELQVISSVSLKNYGVGFKLQVGLNYKIFKKNEISLKLAYQRIGDLILDFEQSYPVDSYLLNFGYNIEL